MSKVYNTMEYNVNELINYLLLYRELILNGQYDPYYKNQAIELLDKISQLEELIQNNSSFATFDFENMKKRFVGVFHPDRFKIKLENIESSDEIFGKTLGIFQNISELRRVKSDSQFKYDSTTGDSYRANAPRNNQYKKSSSYTNNTDKENKQTYQNDDVNDFEDEYEAALPFVLQFISNKFNAIFRGIPSSKEDYENILTRLQKKVDNLQYNDNLFNEVINSIQKRRQYNRTVFLNNMQDEKINRLYYEKISSLREIAYKKRQKYQQAQINCDNRYEILYPEIQGAFNSWQREANHYIAQYRNLVDKYYCAMRELTQDDHKSLTQEIQRMRSYIEKNYTDANLIFCKIRDDVLQNDQKYCELAKNLNSAKQSYLRIEQRFQYVLNNPSKCKAEIRKRITDDYEKKDEEDVIRLDAEKRKKQRNQRKLNDAMVKRNNFVIEYGETYEKSHAKR